MMQSINLKRNLPPLSIETTRLHLKAITANDAKLIFDLYSSDPVATKYMSFKCTGKIEDTDAFIQGAAKFFRGEDSSVPHYVWVIYLKSTNEPIGTVGLGPHHNHFTFHGGYILNQRFWGNGYASEAWNAVLEWAKTLPNIYRVEACHDTENPASGKVLLKSGMQYEGVLRRHTILPNVSSEPRDMAMYAWYRR